MRGARLRPAGRAGVVVLLPILQAFACSSETTSGAVPEPTLFDAGTLIGVEVDGSVGVDPVQPPGGACVTSIDCAGDLVCGYDPTQGCNATGACVAQVSGDLGPPACGCDGLPVQYVTPTETSLPVATPSACRADGGKPDEGDADVDASAADAGASDAGESDASDAG